MMAIIALLAVFAISASPALATIDDQANSLGVYFDVNGTTTCTSVFLGTPFYIYYILSNPSAAVLGYEFACRLPPDYLVLNVSHVGTDFGVGECNFIVDTGGYWLVGTQITLVYMQVITITSLTEGFIAIGPSQPSTIPGHPALLTADEPELMIPMNIIGADCGLAVVDTEGWASVAKLNGCSGFSVDCSNLQDVDWCNLQWPPALTVPAGAASEPIYGQVRIDGGANLHYLIAEVGYGPDGSDPSANPETWQWTAAVYNREVGDNDEFVGSLTIAMPGQYDYCYRYSYMGIPWVYGDLDGSANGYSADQSGVLTVVRNVFTEIETALQGVHDGDVEWGDYDNDGDLDLVLVGDTGAGSVSRVYRNDGSGVFSDIGAGLPGVNVGGAVWGDYDEDRDLDLAIAGDTGAGYLSRIYRNDGGTFVDANAGLAAGLGSRLAWGDYDNDGDLDLFLATNTGDWDNMVPVSRIYRNDGGGVFVAVDCGLPGLWGGSVAWGDYDNDGDLDLFLTGNRAGSLLSRVYRNDAGLFAMAAEFAGTWAGSGEWGDFDNDGDLDILHTGTTTYNLTRVYRNDGGTFTDIDADLPPLQWSTAVWGDCDNDGDLDIMLAGYCAPNASYISEVYRNDGGGVFVSANVDLDPADCTGVVPAAWGDYDNDGRLDIVVATAGHVLRIYRNATGAAANTPPTAPTNLTLHMIGDQVTLNWNVAIDDQTPSTGLSYNVWLGLIRGDIVPPMANVASGFRRIVQLGNAQKRTSLTVKLPPIMGPYYWSVQAIDGAFAGGPFASYDNFALPVDVGEPPTPKAYALQAIAPNPFNPATTITFSLPHPERVRLSIFDLTGRLVRVLLDEVRAAGHYEVPWNGTDDRGQQKASGVYVCRMEAGSFREMRRMTLVK